MDMNTDQNSSVDCGSVNVPIDIRKPWIATTYIYGFSALVLIGIPANILSFVVIRHDRPFSTTRTLLLYLAVADTLILVFEFHCFVLKTIYDVYNFALLEWVGYADPHFYLLTNITKFAQIWITVVISADRYFAICHPFKAVEVRTVRNAERAGVLISIMSIAVNIPRFASYSRIPVQCYNRTMFKVEDSSILLQHFPQYELVYSSILDPLLYYYVPLTALLFFTTCLIANVRRTSAMRGQISKYARNEANITMTLIAIVTTFIICETPTVILFVLNFCMQVVGITEGDEVAIKHTCYEVHEEESFFCFSILALLLSSSTNFFLYVVISQKFRGTLRKMVRSPVVRLESIRSARTQTQEQ